MRYKKVKVEGKDYIEFKAKKAIYWAPDTPAGKTSLDRRRKRD